MAHNIFVPRGVDKEGARTINRYRPFSQVEIHTRTTRYGPPIGKGVSQIDPSRSLLSWTYQKQLSSDNSTDEIGQLSLTLTAGIPGQSQTKTWADLISPMNLIVVTVGNDRQNMRTRFIGYISKVDMQVDTTNAQQPQRSVIIEAQDLMVGLETQMMFITYLLQWLDVPNDSQAAQSAENLLKAFGLEVSAAGQSISAGAIGWLSYFTSFAPQQLSYANLLLMTPSQAIELIISKIASILFNPVNKIGSPYFAGDASYRDLLNLCLADTSLFTGAQIFTQPQNGSVYDLITSMSNSPFLEFWGDVRSKDEQIDIPDISGAPSIKFGPDSAQFCVVLRNTPFATNSQLQGTSPYAFEALSAVDVYLKDTTQQTYGRDTSDVVNYYQTVPEGYMQGGSVVVAAVNASIPAKVDVASVMRYGLQPLTVNVLGFPVSGGAYDTQNINQFNDTLYDWYKNNPDFYKGTVTVHGNPALRVGKRIRLMNLDGHKFLSAYAESVNESFTVMGSYTCQLGFSRGVYQD